MPNTDNLDRTIWISDNLPFLKSLDTESVDLVVIDPPFGKRQTFTGRLKPPLTDAELDHEYELLSSWGVQNEGDAYEAGLEFPDQTGTTASFSDIWDFRHQVTEADWDMLEEVCPPARHLIEATRYTHSDSTAGYIAFMTMRMIEIRRVLKATGSVYLHCDHEANAYLRQMMDAVFGQQNFRNEIVWRRTNANNSSTKKLGVITDTILFYAKSDTSVWNAPRGKRSKSELSEFRQDETGRRYKAQDLTAPGRDPSRMFQWRGTTPSRNWAHTLENLEELDAAGRILYRKDGNVRQRGYIQYLDEMDDPKIGNLWDDIPRVGNIAKERTGYPTQKPQALARRIIKASSNPGDLVLDCFAGCAYVPVAAELTGRRWIACDMSPRAWTIVRRQFHKQPDLRIITEGEYPEPDTGVQPDLGSERIIRVRGPRDLPERLTNGEQKPLGVRTLEPIQFRQKAVETGIEIWEAFVAEWGPECWYCGNEMGEDRRLLHLDHIEPNARDGSNDDCWNRALACAPCNSDKSDQMTVEQAMDKAFADGRIARERLREEQSNKFAERHEWAKERWDLIRPRMLAI